MDPAGQDALAGAGLASQYDRGLVSRRIGREVHHPLHDGALAQEGRLLLLRQPPTDRVALAQCLELEALLEKDFQVGHVDRLGEKLVRAAPYGLDRARDIAVACDDHHGYAGKASPEFLHPVQTVSVRQFQVEKNGVKRVGEDRLTRLGQCGHGPDVVTRLRQVAAEAELGCRFVVHQQDMRFRWHRRAPLFVLPTLAGVSGPPPSAPAREHYSRSRCPHHGP